MEIIKWIILYCCYTGNAVEPDGQIIIKQNTVDAFGITWQITHSNIPDTTRNVIMGGMGLRYIQGRDTIQAHIGIYPDQVIFIMPDEVADMKRIFQHAKN